VRTYFIRHTEELDIDDTTREMLWETRRIAIHFPVDKSGQLPERDNSSLALADYSGSARKAIRILTELAREGGYVCAEYYPRKECLLGYVAPDSQIELVYGKWGKRQGLTDREAALKSIVLGKAKPFRRADLAILVGRPRQGTISRWPSARNLIENLVEGRRINPSLELLSPDQQEILCSEFLRSAAAEALGLARLAHLVLPVGRTMRDIDIFGISDRGMRIFAQVTYRSTKQSGAKLKALLDYADIGRSELILFCDCSHVEEKEGVRIIPLRYVYDQFVRTRIGRKWLEIATAANLNAEG